MHYTKSNTKNAATPANSATARTALGLSPCAMTDSPRASLHLARGGSSAADEVQRIRDEMMRIDMTKAITSGPHQPFII